MRPDDARDEIELAEEDVLDLIGSGELEVLGLLPRASNATLLGRVRGGGREGVVVYKPQRGETPLWDFPRGSLCLRERAAWAVDRALGWGLVPPTVLRDGPAGFGAVQLFVPADPETDVRDLLEERPDELRRIAVFDLVANNADRKAGHCLADVDGRVWSVDHGICFHAEPKLRTVLWAFEGERIPEALVADLERLCEEAGVLREALRDLLAPDEIDALLRRVDALLRSPRFPSPGPGRHVPWPPW